MGLIEERGVVPLLLGLTDFETIYRNPQAEGVTILLVEQGVDFSLALADRVYILGKGSIRHTGPAAELRDDTALRDRLLAL